MSSYYTYISILGSSWIPPVLVGGIRFPFLDSAARFFWLMVVLAFLTDCLAVWAALQWSNNIAVYNLGSILYVFLLCLYADRRIRYFTKSRAGLYIGIVSVTLGIVSILSLNSLQESNIYFRVYMVLVIICLAITLMGFIVFQPVYTDIRKQPHFWLAAILAFFWSFMYLHLLFYDYLTLHLGSHKWLIDRSILVANVANNTAVAIVFLLLPKKQHHESES